MFVLVMSLLVVSSILEESGILSVLAHVQYLSLDPEE